MHIRPTVVEENPGLKFTEVGKIIGAKWKELSDSDKKPFQEREAADKERYKREMDAYKKGNQASTSPTNDDDVEELSD